VIAVAIAAVAYPAGVLSDRWGRKPLTVVSGMLGALGALMLLGLGNVNQVLVVGGILGVSIGIFLSVNWAWATDLVPADEGGLYFGISNLATAGSGVLAGIGGFMLDHFNAQAHNLGYTALYLSAAICYGLGTIIVLRVSDRKQTKKVEST
jgi:MFS family permease